MFGKQMIDAMQLAQELLAAIRELTAELRAQREKA
jgi:hypothetical protein